MKIARILDIKPDGKPFDSQHGTLYPFIITMDDGVSGQANTKTQSPAYKIGDTVGYEITGQTPRGTDKLKIDRKAGQEAQQSAPQPKSTIPVEQQHVVSVPGQTVGMAIKEAIPLASKALAIELGQPIGPDFWRYVHDYASQIIRVSRSLEAGNLTPKPVPAVPRAVAAPQSRDTGQPRFAQQTASQIDDLDQENVPF